MYLVEQILNLRGFLKKI